MAQQDNDVDVSEIEARYGPLSVEEAFERELKSSLSEKQIDLLNKSPSQVFVCGPPGTGKTLLLKRQGVTWLRKGHAVHVLSIFDASRAVSMCVFGQLKKLAASIKTSSRPEVKLHSFNFEFGIKNKDEESKAIEKLTEEAIGREQLCILIDEADFDGILEEFCYKLNSRLPTKLCLCVAATTYTVKLSCLEEIKLTKPLRATQNILREVKNAVEIRRGHVYDYTEISNLTEGTRPKPVTHQLHRNSLTPKPECCKLCGRDVALIIKDLKKPGASPTPLQYRDILFLHSNDTKFGDLTLENGFVKGLSDEGIPVRVVKIGDVEAISKVALMKLDEVIVTRYDNVRGLERKVVIVTAKAGQEETEPLHLGWISRCTEQLIILNWFPPRTDY